MTDPERLLDQKGSDLEVALLRAALDESPPSGLTQRTLAALGAAGALTAAGGSASAASSAAVPAASGVLKGSGAIAGGGIWSALGIGALAGAITVGVVAWTSGSGAPEPAKTAQQAPSSPLGAAAPRATGSAQVTLPPEERADDGLPPSTSAALSAPQAPLAPSMGGPSPLMSGPRGPRPPGRSPPSLAAELALIDAARRSLRDGDSTAALALMERHAREFAGGQLADEAAAIRVEALARLGDRAAARAAARRFFEAHPESPHADRVKAAAGVDATNP